MENEVENHPLMKGSTTEMFKTWLRADHEFVVMCTPQSHAFSSGCSQQSWRWEVERHFFFFGPKMGRGKWRWPKDIEDPSERSEASMGWIGKEVRLTVGDELGERGWAVRLGHSFNGGGDCFLFCCISSFPNTARCSVNVFWMNEYVGYNSDIRARDWHSAFRQKTSGIPSGGKYHFRSEKTEFKSKLHQQAVWPWTSHLTFLSLGFLFSK